MCASLLIETGFDRENLNSALLHQLHTLARQIARYDDEKQPYRSREMPFSVTDEGDYDHLSRFREWSRGDAEE